MRLRNVKNKKEIMDESLYLVKNPEEYKGRWREYFQNNNPIYIEIGMGKGQFIINNALNNPDINYIGIEKYDSVIVRAIQKSDELELNNLAIVRMDARLINEVFRQEVDTIYLNFSDPWTKDRHAKRRLTSPNFLMLYDSIFKNDKKIIMKTDNKLLFEYSLSSLREYGYEIIKMTNNLNCLDDDNIMTEYEEKFFNKGIKINKLEAIKK